MKPRFHDILDESRWSDLFFNFDDCSDACVGGRDPHRALKRAAKSFLRLHPHCPADAAWLVADFKRRV